MTRNVASCSFRIRPRGETLRSGAFTFKSLRMPVKTIQPVTTVMRITRVAKTWAPRGVVGKMAGDGKGEHAGRNGRHGKPTGMKSPLVVNGDAVGLPHRVGDVVPNVLDRAGQLVDVGVRGVVDDTMGVAQSAETESGATDAMFADGHITDIGDDNAGD